MSNFSLLIFANENQYEGWCLECVILVVSLILHTMDTSVFLAQAMGILFVTIGLGMALNMSHFQTLLGDMLKSPSFLYLSGVINVILGSLLVLHHNIWTGGWVVLVTVLCWLTLIKGFMWVVFPAQQMKLAKSLATSSVLKLSTLVLLVLGVYLVYVGFFL